MVTEPLWRPSQEDVKKARLEEFRIRVNAKYQLDLKDYAELHQWSVDHHQTFWSELFETFGLIYEGSLRPALTDDSFHSYGWFPEVKMNFAENLLKQSESAREALVLVHESGKKDSLSYKEVKTLTARLQGALRPLISPGDVVACYMPNISETVISMLATTALGGVFTSTSSDFGVEGVVDRFSQSRPKVLVATTHYEYGGKRFDQREKIKQIAESLPFVEKVILVDFLGTSESIEGEKFILWEDFLSDQKDLDFQRLSFSDPVYIMYSSGTTGKPKCIVHGIGGVLLQHVKELGLHTNLGSEETIMYFTTCGWMMWNWLVSSLFFGARIVLYEGSPGYPSLNDFFEVIDREGIHYFGTSPKFLRALEDHGWNKNSELSSLKAILSTGAPLLPEQFDFVYEKIKSDVQIASICGGTDILGCFMLGNPILPVFRGEIQCLGLGMDVACFDEQGHPVESKEGELVCQKTFPSRPICFLGDEDKSKINDAYFNHFSGVWHHGDFIQITEHGGVKVFGRSDATLNPGGVRIGTSEIYRQTETISYLEDSLCVGRPTSDGDIDVLLFVKMNSGEELTDERMKEIRRLIREKTTPRHMPREVIAVKGIPYTRSGKKMELPITRLLSGKPLTNIEAVANPECLKEYEKFALN